MLEKNIDKRKKINDKQRISNQSSLGLISPISPTSPGMDWVTITILKMD